MYLWVDMCHIIEIHPEPVVDASGSLSTSMTPVVNVRSMDVSYIRTVTI